MDEESVPDSRPLVHRDSLTLICELDNLSVHEDLQETNEAFMDENDDLFPGIDTDLDDLISGTAEFARMGHSKQSRGHFKIKMLKIVKALPRTIGEDVISLF